MRIEAQEKRRRALCAIALLRLGKPQLYLSQAIDAENPDTATSQIHWSSECGVPIDVLLKHLRSTDSPPLQRFLLLTLAEFGLDANEQQRVTLVARSLFTETPDPAVRSTASWLLRQLGTKLQPQLSTKSLSSDKKRWYVNSQGQQWQLHYSLNYSKS